MQSTVLEASNVPKTKFVANAARLINVPSWNVSCELGQHFSLNSTTGALTYLGNRQSVLIQLCVASAPQNASVSYYMSISGSPTGTVLIANSNTQVEMQSGCVVCNLKRNDTIQIGALSDNPVNTEYPTLRLIVSPLA
jgi:hypothetical protein